MKRIKRALAALRQTRPIDWLLCVLAGVLTFASFPTALAPEYELWPLIWISHVPLLWLLRNKGPKAAFWWGLACGAVINGGGYYWITDLLITFGQMPWPLAVLGWLLHSLQLGLMWAIWARLINRIGNTTPVPIQWSAPLVMVAIELIWPRLFPAYMGNSQYAFLPVMQIADLVGVYGVTFLIYRVNAVLYLWLRCKLEGRGRPMKATLSTAAMVAITLAYGGVRIFQFDAKAEEAAKLKIGVAENDVGIFQRETREKRDDHVITLQRQTAELEAQGADLVLWSETAYRATVVDRRMEALPTSDVPLPASAREDAENRVSRRDRRAIVRGFSVPVLFGLQTAAPRAPRYEGDGKYAYFNSAYLIDGGGAVQGIYDKVYLLMFGEYIPFSEYFPWIFKYVPAAGDLTPGESTAVIETDIFSEKLGVKAPVRIGVIICYEGIIPSFTAQIAEGRPHFLANLTNDDWFGLTAERYLHLILTLPRAIENRVPLIRATNTGVSAFVDPVGRLVKQTAPVDPEILMDDVPLMQSATVYQIIGDAFAWGCLILTFGLWGWGRWRRR